MNHPLTAPTPEFLLNHFDVRQYVDKEMTSLRLHKLSQPASDILMFLITNRNSLAQCGVVYGLAETRLTNITQKIRTFDGR